MSFAKAEQLIELATLASGRRTGITLDDVAEHFGVVKRTAQRMMRALELTFPETESSYDHEGRKRWVLSSGGLRDLLTVTADELAALGLAAESFRVAGHSGEAARLNSLRSKVLALVPPAKAARLEPDLEALLEAQGLLFRPGPRPHIDPGIAWTLAEAVKSCRMVDVSYRAHGEPRARRRRIAPYGILLGHRRYLVGRMKGAPQHWTTLYRADAIRSATISDESFVRPPDFDLREFANRSFGAFQREEEYGEVVWRFAPEVADHARGFTFHPDQVLEQDEDGALIVRFHASGHLEMCWYLYAWGDKVEVLAPDRLREMVEGYRRDDFEAVP